MFDIILSRLAYVKGGSLNLSHSQGRNGTCREVLEGEITTGMCRKQLYYTTAGLFSRGDTEDFSDLFTVQ